MERSSSPPGTEKLQPESSEVFQAGVSIETELALEQLKLKHQEELRQLNVQLETQVNYYERRLELMRQSMEVERKDICQAFKLEICELEEQKSKVEQQVKQLKDTADKLSSQLQSGGGGWSSEQQRRMQRLQAESEQNFATEIRNLVQRLSLEKEQLEAELKLKMDQEVQLLRTQLEEERSETMSLQQRLHLLQQEVQSLEEEAEKRRRRLQEEEQEQQRSREEQERLHRENCRCREEVLLLSSRNLQLSNQNADLTGRLQGEEESVRMLREHLEEEGLTVRRMQDAALQLQVAWTQEKTLLQEELANCKKQLSWQRGWEAELRGAALKLQQAEDQRSKLLRDAEDGRKKLEALQQSLVSMETQAQQLHAQVNQLNEDKRGHAHQVTELQLKLQQAQSKVEQVKSNISRLMEEKEKLRQTLEEQQELHKSGDKSQILKLIEEQQSLRSRLKLEEEAHLLAQDQALRANTTLSLVQDQLQQLQQEQQQLGDGRTRQVVLLEEEQQRGQRVEEVLKLQIQQQQVQYEKTASVLQQRNRDLEVKLKSVQLLLQEKVEQLHLQLAKSSTCSARLKEAYVENVQLMAALSVTERRQKEAEKKNHGLEDQIEALKQLLKEVVSVILAT